MKSLFTLVCIVLAWLSFSAAQAQSKVAPKPAAKAPVKVTASAVKKPVAVAVKKPAVPAAKTAVTVTKTAAPVATPKAIVEAPPALVTSKMETLAANTSSLKVQANANPVTGRLTVRTNSPNPTRVEINGPDGRPVVTRDLISSNETAVLDVRNLPPGAYIVQCTSGERRGMKRVMVGQ